MAATIRKLATRRDQLRRDQAERLRQALLPFETEMPVQVRALILHVDQQTAATYAGWTFVMVSPEQHDAVVTWLETNSRRPLKAIRVWSLSFRFLRLDTGEIMLTRDEFADRLQIEPRTVSEIMTELEGVGAVIRHRQKVSGLRGPGITRYFMNPRVGTHLAGAARDAAQADAPALRLIR